MSPKRRPQTIAPPDRPRHPFPAIAPREINPIVRGWIAYYGQYSRSALYPMARYINETLYVWFKRKYKRFRKRLGQARLFVAKIARENRKLFVHWQLGNGTELA
ncbi:group II intron maturase-specific domain-containing protein [Ensifer sp. SL37]|uniref:group II intron maturase-specific domain-containing protein n=1 Tax=Ensifer sp. SL37 TaxID=2995137 RepID=UPI003FA37DE1